MKVHDWKLDTITDLAGSEPVRVTWICRRPGCGTNLTASIPLLPPADIGLRGWNSLTAPCKSAEAESGGSRTVSDGLATLETGEIKWPPAASPPEMTKGGGWCACTGCRPGAVYSPQRCVCGHECSLHDGEPGAICPQSCNSPRRNQQSEGAFTKGGGSAGETDPWDGLKPAQGADAVRCVRCGYMRVNHWAAETFGKCEQFRSTLDDLGIVSDPRCTSTNLRGLRCERPAGHTVDPNRDQFHVNSAGNAGWSP